MTKSVLAIAAAAAFALAAGNARAVEVQLINLDAGSGTGLDDPAPRAPQGGNPGVTLGEQRRIVYQFAADLWSAVLRGNVPVRVTATFVPQTCTATSAVLGSAGATRVFRDFAGAVPATWYSAAATKGITGVDVTAALNPNNDVASQFNSLIGTDPNCLGGRSWYYGLDGNTPPGDINFLNVVTHEIGHGLGFQGFESLASGAFFAGFPSIYGRFAFDNVIGASIANLPTNLDRALAMRRDGALVWAGPNVTAQVPLRLDNRVEVRANAPAAVAGFYARENAAFGPAAVPSNFGGNVALVDDGTGATASLGCNALVNAAAIAGRIALVDRGVCGFTQKVLNAQAAGATGVMIANNAPGLIVAGPTGAPGITIPVLMVEQATGAAFKANLAGLNVSLATNTTRYVGADNANRAQLFAPAVAQSGSSYSHFDTRHVPNALMEPSITTTLRANLNLDLTPALFADQGYGIETGGARIGGCDTTIPVFEVGGAIVGASVIANSKLCAAGASNRGQYQSCIVAYGNSLKDAGLISGRQKGKLSSCAATSGP
jgi:hypothetical protein